MGGHGRQVLPQLDLVWAAKATLSAEQDKWVQVIATKEMFSTATAECFVDLFTRAYLREASWAWLLSDDVARTARLLWDAHPRWDAAACLSAAALISCEPA